jgi:hypothetical protein
VKDELWFQLVFVAIAVVFWVWRTIRNLKKRSEQARRPVAPDPVARDHIDEPGPRTFLEQIMEQSAQFDPAEQAAGQVLALEEISQRAARIRPMCTGPRLIALGNLMDDAVLSQLEQLQQRLERIAVEPPSRATDQRIVEIESEITLLRGISSVIARAVVEHLAEGFEKDTARTVTVARILHDRMSGIAGRSRVPLAPPTLFAMSGASDLHPSLLSALARAGALPVDRDIGQHPHPLAWCAQARHIAGWTLFRIPGLGTEIAELGAAALQAMQYQRMELHPSTIRMVFTGTVCAMMLGESWTQALGSGWLGGDASSNEFGIALARRALVAADDLEGAPPGDLGVQTEILVDILARQSLWALDDTRLPEAPDLRLDHVDIRHVTEAAGALVAGTRPATREYFIVLGAMRCAQDDPESLASLAGLVDGSLGLARDDDEASHEPVMRGRHTRADRLISRRAIREAIILGAIMKRPIATMP